MERLCSAAIRCVRWYTMRPIRRPMIKLAQSTPETSRSTGFSSSPLQNEWCSLGEYLQVMVDRGVIFGFQGFWQPHGVERRAPANWSFFFRRLFAVSRYSIPENLADRSRLRKTRTVSQLNRMSSRGAYWWRSTDRRGSPPGEPYPPSFGLWVPSSA